MQSSVFPCAARYVVQILRTKSYEEKSRKYVEKSKNFVKKIEILCVLFKCELFEIDWNSNEGKIFCFYM